MPLTHTALLCIILYPSHCLNQHCCWIILWLSHARVQDWVKISTVREKCAPEASFKNHRGIILCSQWWHQHMCTKPTRLHAWAFEWVEEEIESENVWRGKKREGETIWLSCICGSYIFSNAIGLPVSHFACLRICGLITARYKTSWHCGWRFIFFREGMLQCRH